MLNALMPLNVLYNLPQSLETNTVLSKGLDCPNGNKIPEIPPSMLSTPLGLSKAWNNKTAFHPVE
jgi:hypothetical protein